ncbi:bZIP transcription factor [Diaporthe helianthi]|uniref:BZIP transcription factor n=1 Tax=Diaporthe helianthi TaxID=158607 RepID=A0A2P5IBX5_DIAHE|nr:bZIP transcription factor [Diaporthe helianthi]
MEDHSHYTTSDLVDFDPFSEPLEDEVIVASTEFPLTSQHRYSSIDPSMLPSPRSSLGQSPVMSFQDMTYSDQVCDPSLLANQPAAPTQSKASEPLTPASFGEQGSISIKSSSTCTPSLNQNTMPPAHSQREDSEPPKKKARQRQIKPAKEESEDEEEEDESTDKRKKFLEKNRIAASKCREKKKKWVHDLENNKSQMERLNMELRLEYRGLMNELNQTKSMLMSHAGCNDPNITEWLNNQARRIVQTNGSSMFPMPNPLSTYPPHGQHQHGNSSNMSGGSMVDLDPSSRRASTSFSQVDTTPPIDPALPMSSVSPTVKEETLANLDYMRWVNE